RALLAQRKARRALKFLEPAARVLPDRYSTHLALGRALSLVGKKHEARAAIDHALQLNPDKAVIAQASEILQEGDKAKAEKLLRDHLVQKPEDAVAIRLLGLIALESNRGRAAVQLFRKVVALAPDFQMAWADLATAYMKRDRFDDALEAIDTAIALDPELPHTRMVRGNVLSKAQRHEEALAAYREATELSPGHPGALAGMGHVLKTIGRQEESIEAYRECIGVNPGFGEAYWSLANLKTFEFRDEEVEVMEKMVAEESLPDEPRVNFLYSLGKHYENEKDFERAFDFYGQGARIRREQEQYDPVHTQVLHDRIIEVFSPEFLAERQGWGDPDPAPILVVGLPRSGSTLIEQILASHSQVEGTQELPDLGRCVGEINRHRKKGMDYPQALFNMNEEDLLYLGKRYLEGTMRFRAGLPRFIDKMPNNYPNIGLLHLMLPNARVIDARRHPLDSCLGSWKQ
ncbi:MAG: tetratricopeptide repeat protein, partial [Gammaproteobacteria bacterium]|nr:tetratricopeptide repeat protein [Gammaproteobacteria bacterium]